MNANVFNWTIGSHKEYLIIAYSFLIESYSELLKTSFNVSSSNENAIRNELVKIAETKKNDSFPFGWITEFPNLQDNNRIDIALATPQSLVDKNHAIKIECKIVGESKYIDTKASFENTSNPTNGIMSFITGKYSPDMNIAGMIGFIKEDNIESKIQKIIDRLKSHTTIRTLKNLETCKILDTFNYSYESVHSRYSPYTDIHIYHLFFDFISKGT